MRIVTNLALALVMAGTGAGGQKPEPQTGSRTGNPADEAGRGYGMFLHDLEKAGRAR